MQPAPQRSVIRPAVAVAVLLAGVVCGVLFRVVGGTEQHAYSPGAVAPEFVRVTAGNTYRVSVPGGVTKLEGEGVDVTTPRCSYSLRGGSSQPLTVQASGTGTKATNALGAFVAPVSGEVHVDCLGWGSLFVDDAESSAPDLAGWLLVATIVLLTIGSGLCLSVLRTASMRHTAKGPRQDEEIERLVQLVHSRSDDDVEPEP